MKKLLICATALFTLAAFADVCIFSIDGIRNKIKVSNADTDDDTIVLASPNWGDENNRAYRLVGNFDEITPDEYTEVSASFKPESDGRLTIQIYGNHAVDKSDRKWIYVKDITINGKPVVNNDYSKLRPNGLPHNFYVNKGLKLIDDGGVKVLCANHDSRVGFTSPDLKGGQVYNLKCKVKAVK